MLVSVKADVGGLQVQRKAKTLAEDENRYLDQKWRGEWDVEEGKWMSMARWIKIVVYSGPLC